MKRFVLICIVLICSLPGFAQRTKLGNNGIGIMVGSQTGINFKHFINQRRGWDAAVSLGKNVTTFYVDYLLHTQQVFKTSNPWFYYGGGVLVATGGNDAVIAARGVVGLEFFAAPFDFFAEIAPVFSLTPATNLDVDLELGVRFYF